MNRPAPRIAAASVAVLLSACQDSSPRTTAGEWSGAVDTLASGRLVVQNPDVPLWRADEAWQLRERFRIGAADGDGPDLFGDIRDVEIGPDGALHVLDAQAAEVRVFGSDGRHVRTFGRSGQGPGELSRPAGMALEPHGVLWIMNGATGATAVSIRPPVRWSGRRGGSLRTQ